MYFNFVKLIKKKKTILAEGSSVLRSQDTCTNMFSFKNREIYELILTYFGDIKVIFPSNNIIMVLSLWHLNHSYLYLHADYAINIYMWMLKIIL